MPGAVNVKIKWSRGGGGGSPPVITSPAFLVTGTVGSVYPTTYFTASGTAPITWSITAGTLPTGMTFSSGGELSGTPTATSSGSITFRATNVYGFDDRALTLTVGAAGSFAAPVLVTAPTIETVISGATINAVGTMVRSRPGNWTLDWLDSAASYANPGINTSVAGTPVKFALTRRYQWLRNGSAIAGQNGVAYTLTNADVGQTISVQETVKRIVPNTGNTAFQESATAVSSTTSSTTITSITGSQTSNLVYQNNIAYLGTFKIHDPYFDGEPGFGGGGQALTFDATGNSGSGSLFMCNNSSVTAEFAIPATLADGFSTSYSSLPEAAKLQSARNATDGWMAPVTAQDPGNPPQVSGQIIYNGNLIQSAGSLYANYGAPVLTHAKRSKTLSSTSIAGTAQVTPSGGYGWNGRWLSGPMCLIPASWQTALGGKVITGWCGVSISSNSCQGAPAFAFDPDQISSGTLTAQSLVGYDTTHALDPESRDSSGNVIKGAIPPVWGYTSPGYGVFGMCIPNGTESILYFGSHPTGRQGYADVPYNEPDLIDSTYGGGTRNSFDLVQGKGPYAWPYAVQCWAFNLNDLALVKAGSLLPYNVKPYSVFTLPLPYASPSASNGGSVSPNPVKGAAYDPASKKIYITHNATEIGSPVVVSVYSVSNAV